jgi:hypothetical protein
MKECLHQVHEHKNSDREGNEDKVPDQELNKIMKKELLTPMKEPD